MQDKDETRILYGKFVPFDEILEGKATAARMSKPFLSTLSNYTGPNGPRINLRRGHRSDYRDIAVTPPHASQYSLIPIL